MNQNFYISYIHALPFIFFKDVNNMRGEINLLWSQTREEGNAPQDTLLVRQQDLIMRNQLCVYMMSTNLQEL